MPRNNLATHLQWFTSARPFVPPAISAVAYDPEAQTESTIPPRRSPPLDESATSYEVESPIERPPAPPPARPVQPRTLTRTRTIDIHNPPSVTRTTSDEMAKLRATPAQNRPKLVIANLQYGSSSARKERDEDDRVQAARRADEGHSKLARSSVSKDATHEKERAGTSYLSSVRKQAVEAFDIDSIDLTGDDNFSSPVPNALEKGRKRKSEEFERDLKRNKPPRPKRNTPARSPVSSDDDFDDIDEMLMDAVGRTPSSPPPPYSTIAINRARVVEQQSVSNQDGDSTS